MSEIIPFDFEEQAVRIVMRDGSPWFVAADICRVLEIVNNRDAVARLDDDERDTVNLNTVGNTDPVRGNPNATIINESGLYALILTSRKEAARRFRKWITAEVLPAIRATGRYIAEDQPPEPMLPGGTTLREAEVWLSIVRTARQLSGRQAAVRLWRQSPLPPLSDALPAVDTKEAQACLDHLRTVATPLMDDPEALVRLGLRDVGAGLFVANGDSPVFKSTRWAAGLHRTTLTGLPGVMPDGPRTLAGHGTRGLLVPNALIKGAEHV